jgi:hypothetical protein
MTSALAERIDFGRANFQIDISQSRILTQPNEWRLCHRDERQVECTTTLRN